MAKTICAFIEGGSMNWTEEQYQDYLRRRGIITAKSKKRSQKYKNNGVWMDGFYFRSQLECKRYCQLKLLKNSGKISGFVLQPEFILQEGNNENRGITYKADFLILNKDGTYEVEDTKGYESQQWKRTYKQFKLRYPDVDLKVLKEV
jgi:allantoicase